MAKTILGLLVTAALLVPRPAAAQQTEYVVGPQDVVTVNVWGQPDVSGKYNVEADGTFTFPLIGRVKAAGLSLHGLEDEIRTRLSGRFFKNPQVTVAIEQYHSQIVNIVGEVRQAGSYPLSGEMRLIDALARAGSTTDNAGPVVVITRSRTPSGGGEDPPEVIRVNLRALQSGALTENIRLRDGDTVFVPRAETFFVSGHVRNPGAFPIQDKTTVMQAIALAGGLTDRGTDRRVQIVRTVDGKRGTYKAGLDDLVQPGDTVIVRERLF